MGYLSYVPKISRSVVLKMNNLTEKQESFLKYIGNFIKEKGYSPSLRDIGKGTGLSPAGVLIYLRNLNEKGYLSYTPKISRSVRLKLEG